MLTQGLYIWVFALYDGAQSLGRFLAEPFLEHWRETRIRTHANSHSTSAGRLPYSSCICCRHVLWRLFRSCIERIMCRCCLALFPQAVEPSPMTFEEALSKGQLEGCPTYRLPHHPRYAAVFSGHLHRAIMLRTLGHDRFTRLVRSLVYCTC